MQDGTATKLLSFTKVMTNDFPLSRSLLSGHAKVTKIANLRRNGLNAILKVGNRNFVANLNLSGIFRKTAFVECSLSKFESKQ